MGADLIGYMIRGPVELAAANREYAIKLGQERARIIANFCSAVEELDPEEPPPSQPLEQPVESILRAAEARQNYEQSIILMENAGWIMEEPDAVYNQILDEGLDGGISDDVISNAVNYLYDIWNKMVQPRDVCIHVFRNQDATTEKVMFAGSTTWGDEPDGSGYEMVKTLHRLKLLDALGLDW